MLKLPYTTPEPKFVGWCAACRQPCGRYVEEFVPTQNIPTGKDQIVSNCCGAELLQEAPSGKTQETPTPETDALIAKFPAESGITELANSFNTLLHHARSLERRLQEAERTAKLQTEEAQYQADMKCAALTRAEAMAGLLRDCVERMERARGILTDGKKDCWSMLDTEQARAALSRPGITG